MPEAPKVFVLVDTITESVRVYSNQPNVMVEVEVQAEEEDEDFLERTKREYQYLVYGSEDEDDGE
jgi:hypothetical protein